MEPTLNQIYRKHGRPTSAPLGSDHGGPAAAIAGAQADRSLL